MLCKAQSILVVAAIVMMLGAIAIPAEAAPISNWKTFSGSPSNSGLNTNSPTIGDGTANNADNVQAGGQFGTASSPVSITLDVGDIIELSGSVTLSGGTTTADNFRFGLFDGAAAFDANSATWSNGGWLWELTDDIFTGRTNGGFGSTGGDASGTGATQTNTGGAFSADSAAAYEFFFSITRDSATTVDIIATLTGGDNAVDYTATTLDETTSLFTYSTVGFLFGGSLDLDQASFSNVQYTFIPEPGSLAMLGLGSVLFLIRKRR